MRRLNSLTGIPLLVLLITTIHGFPALAAADHAADFRAGYFFIDVFGCLFPMNDDYVLKVTTGESYFFWNRNYALGSPPSDIKRISIESASTKFLYRASLVGLMMTFTKEPFLGSFVLKSS